MRRGREWREKGEWKGRGRDGRKRGGRRREERKKERRGGNKSKNTPPLIPAYTPGRIASI